MSDEEIVLTKDYNLNRQIGSGTFGKVFLGTHTGTGNPIAIKVLEKTKILDQADYDRVCREIKIIQFAHHPHLVELLDIIEAEKYIFLVMEYMQGGELYEHIVRNKRLSEAESFRIFAQAIGALEFLHENKIVHRDLKPENILLAGDRQTAKLIDFGLGRSFEAEELLKTPCGSPCYAPPEMLEKRAYDPRKADVWSLGVVLYAMLTGLLPFEDKENDGLFRKIIACKYAQPTFLSLEAQDLISRLITPAETRLSLETIRKQPWFVKNLMATPGFCCSGAHEDFYRQDHSIVEHLVRAGYPREMILHNLEKKIYSDVYCHYRLLKNAKRQLPPCSKLPEFSFDTSSHEQQTPAVGGTLPSFSGPGQGQVTCRQTRLSEYQEQLIRSNDQNVPPVQEPTEELCFSAYKGFVVIENVVIRPPYEVFEEMRKAFGDLSEVTPAPEQGGFLYKSPAESFLIEVGVLMGNEETSYIHFKDPKPDFENCLKVFEEKLRPKITSLME